MFIKSLREEDCEIFLECIDSDSRMRGEEASGNELFWRGVSRQGLRLRHDETVCSEFEAVFMRGGCYDLNRFCMISPKTHAKMTIAGNRVLIIECED